MGGPGLLVEILNFLFYKTLRGLGFQLMVKVFVVLSVNFSEIQQPDPVMAKAKKQPQKSLRTDSKQQEQGNYAHFPQIYYDLKLKYIQK